MEIEKTNRMNALFEFYSTLLTEKQMNYMELYYADDFSLGEIAEEYQVSRQAVYDNIKRTERILEDYEDLLDQLSEYTKTHYPKDETLQGFIQQLQEIEE